MIPKFDEITASQELYNAKREEVILLSRKIVKLSKQAIYASHRGEHDTAQGYILSMLEKKMAMEKIFDVVPKLRFCGSQKIAEQELVEAAVYHSYLTKGFISSHRDLECDEEYYLMGICDLTGELVRRAINAVIEGKHDEAKKVRDTVDAIYGQMLQLDMPNGELRKKFDSIKYNLKKLEEVVYQTALQRT